MWINIFGHIIIYLYGPNKGMDERSETERDNYCSVPECCLAKIIARRAERSGAR